MSGQTRIDGNLIDTGTDPNDILSVESGDGRYPKLDGPNTLTGDLTVGSDALFVDASTGNVGVGTSSPDSNYVLTTNSDSDYQGILVTNSGHSLITIKSTSAARQSLIEFNSESQRYALGLNSDDTFFLRDNTAFSDRFTVDQNGNVGIGVTPTGDAKLEVQSTLQVTDSQSPLIKLRDVGNSTSYIGVSGIGINNAAQDNIYIAGYDAIANNVYDLRIIGFNGDINTRSNLTVGGALSKSSGSFKIDHPLKPESHHLVHSFVEAPQADNIYRGKVDLINGTATVNIDSAAGMAEGTFVALNREVQCFTSNESGWTAVRGSVSGNILTIEAQDNTCTNTVSWMVVGERQDQHMYDTNWTDENGKVIVEQLKETGNTEETN